MSEGNRRQREPGLDGLHSGVKARDQSATTEARADKGAAGDRFILIGLLTAASIGIASNGALFGESSQLVAASLILCLGLVVLVLQWDRVSTIVRSRLGILVAVNGAILIVSSLFSQYHWASVRELLKALALAESFVIAFAVMRHQAVRQRLLVWFYWWSILVTVVGIVVYVFGMRWPGSWLGSYALRTISTFGGRLSTFFGYANTFASFLLLPIALGVVMAWQGGRRANLALPGIVIALGAMQLTTSRWGYVVLVGMLSVMFILALRLHSDGILFVRRRAVAVTGLVLVLALVSLLAPAPNFASSAAPVAERLSGISAEVRNADPATSSIGGRIAMLRDALHYGAAYPVLGSGPGTYSSVYFRFRSTNFFSADPHSLVMLWWTETGLVGLLGQASLLLAVLWLLWLASVRDTGTAPLWLGAAAGVTGVITHAMLDWDFQSFFLPVLVAVVCGAAAASLDGDRQVWLLTPLRSVSAAAKTSLGRLAKPRTYGRTLAISATGLCVAAGMLTASAALTANRGIALASKQPVEAAHLFARARRLNPINAEYPYLYAKATIALTTTGGSVPSMDEAIRVGFDRAIVLNQWYIKYRIERARYLLGEGDVDAVTAYEDLTRIDPGDPGTFASLAWAYHALYGNDAKALESLDQAFAVDPSYFEAWLVLGRIRESQGKTVEAIAAYWKAAEADAADVQALGSLGTIYEAQGNAAGSARASFELVQRLPESASAKSAFSSFGVTIVLDQAALEGRTADIVWHTRGKAVAESFRLVLMRPGAKDTILAEGIGREETAVRVPVPESVPAGAYTLRLYAMAPAALTGATDPWMSWVDSGTVHLGIQ